MNRAPLVSLPPELTEPRAQSDARFILGVDGGATKTLAAVLDLRSERLYLGHGGPSNEDAVGVDAARAALVDSAEQAVEAAGIDDEQLGAAVLAIAGTNTDSVATHVHARNSSWIVVNDVVGAWAMATGAADGVAVISGTGSNVFGVGPRGSWRAGGWGHVLGDEGSGYWLGVESIRAALREREASGPATALSEALTQFFETDSVEALASRVYSQPLTKRDIASFAIEAARVAEEGDAIARGLFEAGARELAGQISAVIAQTGLADSAFPVGLIGSVFKTGALYIEPLAAAIHESAPRAAVAPVEAPPAGGSLLLAARACGQGDRIDVTGVTRLLEQASDGGGGEKLAAPVR